MTIAFSSEEQNQIQQEITKLVKCGVSLRTGANIFLMPKRNGQVRMTLKTAEVIYFSITMSK